MHRSYLTRTRAVVLVAMALAALAACGPFGDDKPAGQDRAGRVLTAAEAKAALPSADSLPRGWGVAARNVMRPKSAARDQVTPARCRPLDVDFVAGYLGGKTKSFKTYARRQVVMGIGIASHPGEAPGFDAIRKAMKTCKTVVVRTPDEVQHGTVKALRVPELGHDAVSIRLKIHTSTYAVTYDAIRVRVGHNWVMGDLGTLGNAKPNTKPLVTAVKNVLLNLS